MKDKFRVTVDGDNVSESVLNYTGSAVTPDESPDQISDKISQMLPQMKCIQATGIIKNTESFKESKHILDTFKTAIGSLPENAFDQQEPTKNEEKDTRGPLDKATDSLHMIVNFMSKAGIKVPQIYKDFLYAVRPQTPSNTLDIEKSQPLFVINGLDEHGNVKVETDTEIELRRGNKRIKLKEEKLRKTLKDSQRVDVQSVRDMRDWVSMNLKKVGSLDKVTDEQWSKLRNMILEKWEKAEVGHDNDDSCSAEDIDDIIKELENESTVGRDSRMTATKIEIPQTVNKNAYEIRLDILKEAIKFEKNSGRGWTYQDVLDTAHQFYKFVENKR